MGLTRHEKIFAGIDLPASRGLEIGPLISPMVPREMSRVLYADHVDTAALRAKYAGDANVPPERIVEVDVVWPGGPLLPLLPEGFRALDYVVASHVVEHVPDLVGWLAALTEALRPGGIIGLVVPDKRFTFDLPRAETRLAEIVDAHLRRADRPSPAQIFDYVAHVAEVDAAAAWRGEQTAANVRRYSTPAHALAEAARGLPGAPYFDVHCWVFTPSSWQSCLAALVRLGLLDLRCRAIFPTERDQLEFVTVLERCPPGEAAKAAASFAPA